MPIWQFEVAVVPRGADMRPGRGPGVTPLPAELAPLLRARLRSLFGSPCIQGRGVESFGAVSGCRVDLVEAGRLRRELWACIDARVECDHFCQAICELARQLDCEFYTPELELWIEPARIPLTNALMRSQAWCYALDPALFGQAAPAWERRV